MINLGKISISSPLTIFMGRQKILQLLTKVGLSDISTTTVSSVCSNLFRKNQLDDKTLDLGVVLNKQKRTLDLEFICDNFFELEKQIPSYVKTFHKTQIMDNSFKLKIKIDRAKDLNRRAFILELKAIINQISVEEQLASDLDVSYEKLKLKSKELAKAKKIAESANYAKSQFLANMSHEIRTPLGAILGFGELLKDPDLKKPERENYTEIINSNGRQLSLLIEDILDLSKIESGHLSIDESEISLKDLLIDLRNTFSIKANDNQLSFEIEFIDAVSEMIVSDRLRLNQILINIVGNAVKFTDEGRVKISIGLKKQALYFEVSDTGIGIPEESQKRLFKPFSQADGSTTRRFGGTGLGLVLSRELAKALGGGLELKESVANKGSVFSFTLAYKPVGNEMIRDLINSKSTEEKSESDESLKSDLKGLEVLVVDDTPENLRLVTLFLNQYEVIVDAATNGKEAVEKTLNKSYDLVFMDIQMPVMDGYDATRRIRKFNKDIPIIALTANAFKEERDKSITVGCNAHLTKPVNQEKLVSTLAQFSKRS